MLERIGEGTAEWGKHTYITYAEGGVNVPENEWFVNQVPASIRTKFETIVQALCNGEISVSTAYGASTDDVDAMKTLASSK